MNAPTINCPSGHVNSANQKFCGECGSSLAGVCPNGHQNPDGQRFCGECGQPLDRPSAASHPADGSNAPTSAPKQEIAPAATIPSSPPGSAAEMATQGGLTAATVLCANGHANPRTRSSCRECDGPLSLTPVASELVPAEPGQCSLGHQNPGSRTQCRECGEQLTLVARIENQEQAQQGRQLHVGATFTAGTGTPTTPSASSAQMHERTGGAEAGTLNVGDRITLSQGVEATVVGRDADMVSLDVIKGGNSYGVSKYPWQDIEAALAANRIAVIQRAPTTPGWYPDPADGQRESFWDGTRWRGGRLRAVTLAGRGVSLGQTAPTGSTDGIQAWWPKLPSWAKVATIAVPALVLLILVLALGGIGAGRDWESYNWGYNKGTQGWTQTWANYSKKDACESILKLFYDLPGGEGVDRGDAMEGCMDAVNKYPRRTN